jgi:hypothetical protein
MKEVKLFAIYKNGEHKGNERGVSINDAIKKYLIASFFETLLDDFEFTAQYTASIAIENVHFTKQIFEKSSMLKIKKSKENYWSFIEAFYPNYHSCNQILLSDILARKLDGEEIDIKDEKMIKDWNVKEELLKLDQAIMQKTMENYFEIKYSKF